MKLIRWIRVKWFRWRYKITIEADKTLAFWHRFPQDSSWSFYVLYMDEDGRVEWSKDLHRCDAIAGLSYLDSKLIGWYHGKLTREQLMLLFNRGKGHTYTEMWKSDDPAMIEAYKRLISWWSNDEVDGTIEVEGERT
jgi:hypothetical protein